MSSSEIQKKKPEPEKNENGIRIITEKFCCKLCYYNGGYDSPEFNGNLYLHFFGFKKIENLDNFKNCSNESKTSSNCLQSTQEI